jgi:hypothetical protein
MARLRSVDGVVPAVLANGKRGGPGGGAERSIDMDAVEFIRERNRMCGTMSEVWGVDAAQIVKNTEEWSAAHPRKTRQSVFLEQYPEARIYDNGVLGVCPAGISLSHRRDGGWCLYPRKDCGECRREFWMQEVE